MMHSWKFLDFAVDLDHNKKIVVCLFLSLVSKYITLFFQSALDYRAKTDKIWSKV